MNQQPVASSSLLPAPTATVPIPAPNAPISKLQPIYNSPNQPSTSVAPPPISAPSFTQQQHHVITNGVHEMSLAGGTAKTTPTFAPYPPPMTSHTMAATSTPDTTLVSQPAGAVVETGSAGVYTRF